MAGGEPVVVKRKAQKAIARRQYAGIVDYNLFAVRDGVG